MSFIEAVQTCLKKWITFSGRATRSEFWWYYLFTMIVQIVLTLLLFSTVDWTAIDPNDPMSTLQIYAGPVGNVMGLVGLFFFISVLAAGARRLHDTGKSGWWQLILLLTMIPLVGILALVYMIYLWVQKSQEGSNQYG